MENNVTREVATVTFEDPATKQQIIVNLVVSSEENPEERTLEYQVTFNPEIVHKDDHLGLIGELASIFLQGLTNK